MDGRMPGGPGDLVRAFRNRGPQTRQELGTTLGLTRAQVDQRLDQLRELELLDETTAAVATGGRRARPVGLTRHVGHVIAISMGITGVTVGAVDLNGELLDDRSKRIDIADGPHDVLGECLELCDQVSAGVGGEPWAVGVAVPGPVDINKGIVVSPPIMPQWDQFPIRAWLASKMNTSVWLDNDANATALGELRYGAGRGHDDMVYVKLGSGIGAGIIMGGVLQHGNGGCAGDVGHLPVPGSVAPCRCGNTGCLEAVAGGLALAREAERLANSGESNYLARIRETAPLDAAALAAAAEHGDDAAYAVLHRAGGQIGEVLASVVSLLNPSQLVFGGGLAFSGDVLISSLRKSLYARALPLASRDLIVRRSTLGEAGGILGVAEIVFDELFSPPVLEHWGPAGTPQSMSNLGHPRHSLAGIRSLE